MSSTRAIAATLVVAIGIAGCTRPPTGSVPSAVVSSSPSATASLVRDLPGVSATARAAPTPEPTAEPSKDPDRPELHADRDLEAYLPTTENGAPVLAMSVAGAAVAAQAGGDFAMLIDPNEFVAFADELRVTPDRMTLAFAAPENVRSNFVLMYGYRAPGVSAKRLLEARHAMGGLYRNRIAAAIPVTRLRIAGRRVFYLPASPPDEIEPSRVDYAEYDVAYRGVLVAILGESPAADGTIAAPVLAAIEGLP